MFWHLSHAPVLISLLAGENKVGRGGGRGGEEGEGGGASSQETNQSVCFTAGEDAVKFESLPDDVVVAKALSVLRSIFGDQTVPEVSPTCTDNLQSVVTASLCLQPKESHVTRWRQDDYARGSYSYVAAGSSGNDYDFLAAAVSPARNGPLVPRPRVFFGGELAITETRS